MSGDAELGTTEEQFDAMWNAPRAWTCPGSEPGWPWGHAAVAGRVPTPPTCFCGETMIPAPITANAA